jgi:PAS domain S-box-containing protein
MSINKELLNRLNILYVEDDHLIRTELAQILSNFFGKVYTAEDGKEGLETYLHNQDDIDIILSDINMPKLNGIEMVKTIRGVDKKVPVFFATAYSDIEFLSEAIKLHIHEYIVKPIDVRSLLAFMNDLAAVLYQESLIKLKTKELSKYKKITDLNNIVIETDVHMKITNVNDLFCKISGYTKDELLGKDFKFLKHQNTSNDVYTEIYAKVLNNKMWQGRLKNLTKDHGTFTTECYMMAVLNDASEVIGAISIQKDITEELTKKREVQLALMKDKSDIFKRSKEGNAEQYAIINDLKNKLESIQSEKSKSNRDIDKYIYTAEKYTVENRRLKTELSTYKKNADTRGTSLKLSKESADLRVEVKRLINKIKEIKENNEQEIKQVRINYEIEIDEIEDKLEATQAKLDAIETNDVLSEKLEYWKDKSKNESNRVENLEKQIIANVSKEVMSKIFN